MQQQEVDYLIIGAGMAGTVLHKFLNSDSVVLLDPKPGGYKIGESIIPEHFHHPVMAEMLDEVKKLPSYSPKWGSTFISRGSVASFPLPEHGVERAMHIAREELEPLMHRLWGTPIVEEAVRAIDLDTRTVSTATTAYKVRKQILDCSGPAMVLARLCGEINPIRPVFSRWGYFDITHIDNDDFWAYIRDNGMSYRRYDIPKGRLLEGAELGGWQPAKTTILTEIEPGVWTWQIPMYGEKILSFGVVSRHGKVSSEQLQDLAENACAPQYTLQRRTGEDWLGREHVRNGFAQLAKVPATRDYVLLADACAFADPIYSVGTGLAVNKAIELAGILNDTGWTDEACTGWCQDYERLLTRAVEAFETWYDGDLLSSDDAAREVQQQFLVGTAFQVGIAHRYSQQIVDAGRPADEPGPGGRGRHIVDASQEALPQVAEWLGLSDASLAGWHFDGAWTTQKELQLRWSREGKPQLIINASFSPDATRYYRRVGDISLSFMNLMEAPYPLDDTGVKLFDALEGRIGERREDWTALGRSIG